MGRGLGRPIPGAPTTPTNEDGDNIGNPGDVTAVVLSDLRPKDTFFDGKLYVSNRHDPFEDGNSVEGGYNTVLVTLLGDPGDECLNVRVRNTRSKASITLALVPATTDGNVERTVDGNR